MQTKCCQAVFAHVLFVVWSVHIIWRAEIERHVRYATFVCLQQLVLIFAARILYIQHMGCCDWSTKKWRTIASFVRRFLVMVYSVLALFDMWGSDVTRVMMMWCTCVLLKRNDCDIYRKGSFSFQVFRWHVFFVIFGTTKNHGSFCKNSVRDYNNQFRFAFGMFSVLNYISNISNFQPQIIFISQKKNKISKIIIYWKYLVNKI